MPTKMRDAEIAKATVHYANSLGGRYEKPPTYGHTGAFFERGSPNERDRDENVNAPLYFFFVSRKRGDSVRVKSTTSSPLTVLMSW